MNLCKHCRWSRYGYTVERKGLVCINPKTKVTWCKDACDEWEREPGIDDDKGADDDRST